MRVLDLISKHEIDKQETLVDMLATEGYKVTQATVSRDIKELGLVKALGENKKYKYVCHSVPKYENGEHKLYSLFKSAVTSIASAENIVVVKTLPGSANTAAALIDKMNYPEVLGVVAGDDTIIAVVTSTAAVPGVIEKFYSFLD
jgi:transcriptional regulator of arginine metabolism